MWESRGCRERAANDIRANAEEEKKQAEDMRAKTLEKVGETRKRVVGDDVSEEPWKKEERTRRSGQRRPIAYLKEKSEKEFKIKQEELEPKKQEQCAQVKRQKEMTQQLIHQQEQQQTMFANLQQQQHQQLQQLSQMQMTIMQQQQQQQALVAVLQELAKKK